MKSLQLAAMNNRIVEGKKSGIEVTKLHAALLIKSFSSSISVNLEPWTPSWDLVVILTTKESTKENYWTNNQEIEPVGERK